MLNATQNLSSLPGAAHVPREVRCLLLDDSSLDRARLRRLSQKTAMAIYLDEVESIAQLDVALTQEVYDLILIDYRLPVGDGIVALDHVMRSGRNSGAAKIMITGDEARKTVLQALRAGCHDFLTKEEIDVTVLEEAISNALSAARQHAEMVQDPRFDQETIRKGLISAIQDSEVQNNVATFLKSQMSEPAPRILREGLDAKDLEALLSKLSGKDGPVVH